MTALDRRQPDQVPVTWELVNRSAYALTGRTGWRAICDTHRLIGSAIFNVQGIGPEVHAEMGPGHTEEGRPAGKMGSWALTEYVLRTPSGELTMKTAFGGLPHDPIVGRTMEYYVKRREDYEIIVEHYDEWAKRAEPRDTETRTAIDFIGEDGIANHWMCDSLYALATARHPEEFIVDLVEAKPLMHKVLEVVHRRTERMLEAFNASPAEALVWDTAFCSTSLVNPEIAREFAVPELKWALANLAPGKRLCLFISGRMRDLVPMMIEAGATAIQHFDGTGGGDCDLAEIKRTFGDQICIMGNYNPVILARGTVEEARAEARRCFESAMAGGAYILTTADEVPADAKLENMRAVVEEADTAGRY